MYALDQPAIRTDASVENSVLKTLAWFDLFHHPLTEGDLLYFLDRAVTADELQAVLQKMCERGDVFSIHGFYALHNEPGMAAARKKSNEKAAVMPRKAHRIGRLLQQFPYVRAVCISGSLSKNVAGDHADIDFFIIAARNRLWIARTAMHALKKLSYLWGGQHHYCMNYFVDEEALLIGEQNMFTAVEMITLMPVCGDQTIQRFFVKNEWVRSLLPAYRPKEPLYPRGSKGGALKRCLEWMFRNPVGEALDNYLMKVTARRWKKKETQRLKDAKGATLALATDKHYCRPNPVYFQQDILSKYEAKLQGLWSKRYQRQLAAAGER